MATFSSINASFGYIPSVSFTQDSQTCKAVANYAIDPEGVPLTGNLITTRWSPSSIHTSAVTATASVGKVIHQPATISGLTRGTNASGWLHGVRVLDKGYQRPDIAVLFLSAAVSFPSQGAAMSLSDADALLLFNRVEIYSQYYKDNTLNYIANLDNLGIPLFPLSGTDDVNVALLYLGTSAMTFGASDLVIDFITRN